MSWYEFNYVGQWGWVLSGDDKEKGDLRETTTISLSWQAKEKIWGKRCFKETDGWEGIEIKISLWAVFKGKRASVKSYANLNW